ncbi:tRNA 2-thiocytidine(32) synthetase TtcA [Pajaroellobacter abortibovis]|uniref:tRNA 2-thiocytidine(32) synthetase TtcA n=1 Tax=Pajaroellobacter abortibovis TaxID=1882918 RepID=A0A1L6MYR5_9BACT|nr:tRNA 2-thiocytidine(32) synthetase TtcA [Pajaroellobacter abortibovis]APS00558.1 tRNA 2-thiocytidine(32) synthetase TtcA [Pajaroellobacter abortibovis]
MEPLNLLEQKLSRLVGRAIADFEMLAEGDCVMVAVSGGKDSYTLLHLLRRLQEKAPIRFELKVVNLDQGHPGYPAHLLRDYMKKEGYEFYGIQEDTYSIVKEQIPEGKTCCSLCSRLRRGILYRVANELGCTKIALGHHRDDILQTFFLNLFFAGQLAAMPPKLLNQKGEQIVIRPLTYCSEEMIRQFSERMNFPILPCDLCGMQSNLRRKVVGNMIREWEEQNPGIQSVMFAALQNVQPTHLLDKKLWNALNFKLEGSKQLQEECNSSLIPVQRLFP